MCDSEAKLNQVVDGYQNYEKNTGALDSDFNQSGGGTGFILDVEQPTIGGQAQVTGYVSQPEYVNGALVQQRTPDGRLVGDANLCGGGKKKMKVNKNNNKNNNTRVNNVRINNNNNKANNNKATNNKVNKKENKSRKRKRSRSRKPNRKRSKKWHKNKSKYSRRNRSKNRKRLDKRRRSKKNRHRGGGCDYQVQGEELVSNFDANMTNREFGCRQPNWDPKCT